MLTTPETNHPSLWNLQENQGCHQQHCRNTGEGTYNPPDHSTRPEPYTPNLKCRHHQIRASIGNSLDLRIQHFHNTGSLACSSIFICSLMSHLPWTIHFISQTPGLNVMRLCMTVGLTHVAVIGTALKITVFQKISGFLRSSCSKDSLPS